MTETIDVLRARRLALIRSGLMRTEWTSMPKRAVGRRVRARRAAHKVIERFGYLQLDSIPVSGARTHGLVLASRISGFDARFAEELLQPGEPLFEYWGHEASWIPMDLYPAFGFRRREFAVHPWWGDLLGDNPKVVDGLLRRIEQEGPLRSKDFEGGGSKAGWWDLKLTKKVLVALWTAGRLCVAERRGFQRIYDLPERVIPDTHRDRDEPLDRSLDILLLKALDGHGWASLSTLLATWRLTKYRAEAEQALERLREQGKVVPCDLLLTSADSMAEGGRRKTQAGWIRPDDLELAERASHLRPRGSRGVLLSPFDPLLWDRGRLQLLFGFEQAIEVYKPESERKYGYYSLPVLMDDQLIARVDLKAHRKAECLETKSLHFELNPPPEQHRRVTRIAISRHANSVGLAAPIASGVPDERPPLV